MCSSRGRSTFLRSSAGAKRCWRNRARPRRSRHSRPPSSSTPKLVEIGRRVEVLRARAAQENVGVGTARGAGEPARRSGGAVREGDCRVAGERVSSPRSRRRSKRSRGRPIRRSRDIAEPSSWIRPTQRRACGSARFSTRADDIEGAMKMYSGREQSGAELRAAGAGWRRWMRASRICACPPSTARFPRARRSREAISRRSSASGWTCC